MTEKSLVKKINEIMAAVGYLQKKGRNDKQKYNFVQEVDVVDAVRDLMIEKNLVIFPDTDEIQVTPSGTTKSGSSKTLTTVKMRFTLVDGDSGEEREISMGGQGEDMGDKGIYKASTGANKYALMKLFQIPTGDDPERDGDRGGGSKQQSQPQQRQQQKQQNGPQGPSAIDVENQGLHLKWSFDQLMTYINSLRQKNGSPPVKDVFEMDPQWMTAVYNALDKRIKGGK